jgi:CheY-like chemotaxis protein
MASPKESMNNYAYSPYWKKMSTVALIVDDSMLIRHTVSRFLEERGYGVQAASDGIEALRELDQMRPDVIVTDIDMPHMDGPTLIATLKSRPEYAAIPVVVLSAKRTASACQSRLPSADFIVYKDIDIEQQLAKALTALDL